MRPLSAKTVVRATVPILSIETLRLQCEVVPIDTDSDLVQSHPDDALLLAALTAAVDHAERFTGRAIDLRTFEFALDDFPRSRCGNVADRREQNSIEIPYPPLVEIVSFAYDGAESDSPLVEGDDFIVDTYGDKAVLKPLGTIGGGWPSVVSTTVPNLVVLRYRAGYQSEVDPDSDAEPLPGSIRAALLLTVGHLYANREASVDKAMAELPMGVEAFLRPLRVLTGMA